MIEPKVKRWRLARAAVCTWTAACLAAGSVLPSRVLAADQPEVAGVDLQLLAGPVANGIGQAGLLVRLQPGWKTYWRYPGDSGVPPELDTTGSINVAGIDIGFPPPERSGPVNEQTIGYYHPVTLLLKVRLIDPSRPADLVVTARLGVCRDICVPVEAALQARFDPQAPPDPAAEAELARAAAAVPQPVVKGDPLSVTELTRQTSAASEGVTFTVNAASEKLRDVFVEGPDGWALPLPDRKGAEGDRTTWSFALDGLPAGAHVAGTELTFTIVGTDRATVQRWVLQ